MNCPECSAEIAEESVFCGKCGAEIRKTAEGSDAAYPSDTNPGGQTFQGNANGGATPKERFMAAGAATQVPDLDPEATVWSGTYSPRDMFGTWVAASVVTVGMAVGFLTLMKPFWTAMLWFLGATAVLWIVLGLRLLYLRMSVYYELTSQRFIHKRGVFKRMSDRIEVIDIDDVTFEQGLVQRMLGIGTIKIQSSDRSHPELIMVGIENVEKVAGLIDDLRRAERRRRGLHIEAI